MIWGCFILWLVPTDTELDGRWQRKTEKSSTTTTLKRQPARKYNAIKPEYLIFSLKTRQRSKIALSVQWEIIGPSNRLWCLSNQWQNKKSFCWAFKKCTPTFNWSPDTFLLGNLVLSQLTSNVWNVIHMQESFKMYLPLPLPTFVSRNSCINCLGSTLV